MNTVNKMTFTEAKEDEGPVCPSCKKKLKELKFKRHGWLTTMTAVWCPYCLRLLSATTTFNG